MSHFKRHLRVAFLFCYQILMLKVNVICGRFKNAFTFLCDMGL